MNREYGFYWVRRSVESDKWIVLEWEPNRSGGGKWYQGDYTYYDPVWFEIDERRITRQP